VPFFICTRLNLASHQQRARQQKKQADDAVESSQEHRRQLGEMQDRAKEARERVEQAKTSQTRTTRKIEVSFLMTELNTGLGLAAIALSAADTDTFDRKRQRARAAYDTVLRFSDRVPLTKEQSREMNGTLASLKEHLAQLGESL
jgi:hypothetical protein